MRRRWALAQLGEEIACPRSYWGVGSVHTDTVHDLHQRCAGADQGSAQTARTRLTAWLNPSKPAALVDKHGLLHMTDARFCSLLRRSWPHWGGAHVPPELHSLARTPDATLLGGTRWSATDLGSLVYLTRRPLGALGLLKEREQQIALAIVAGATYRDTAKQFNISPHTVRSNTARIYRKLGVSNKQELARRPHAYEPASSPLNETDTLAVNKRTQRVRRTADFFVSCTQVSSAQRRSLELERAAAGTRFEDLYTSKGHPNA